MTLKDAILGLRFSEPIALWDYTDPVVGQGAGFNARTIFKIEI